MFDKNDPDFQLVAEEWPTFLYDEEAGWNANKAEHGLFRGHVLTRVCSMPPPRHLVHCSFAPHLRLHSGYSETRLPLRQMGLGSAMMHVRSLRDHETS